MVCHSWADSVTYINTTNSSFRKILFLHLYFTVAKLWEHGTLKYCMSSLIQHPRSTTPNAVWFVNRPDASSWLPTTKMPLMCLKGRWLRNFIVFAASFLTATNNAPSSFVRYTITAATPSTVLSPPLPPASSSGRPFDPRRTISSQYLLLVLAPHIGSQHRIKGSAPHISSIGSLHWLREYVLILVCYLCRDFRDIGGVVLVTFNTF